MRTAEVEAVLNELHDLCVESSGIANVWIGGDGRRYMFDVSNARHPDGSVTGSVFVMVAAGHARDDYRQCGTWELGPYGDLVRGPRLLRQAAQNARLDPEMVLQRCEAQAAVADIDEEWAAHYRELRKHHGIRQAAIRALAMARLDKVQREGGLLPKPKDNRAN